LEKSGSDVSLGSIRVPDSSWSPTWTVLLVSTFEGSEAYQLLVVMEFAEPAQLYARFRAALATASIIIVVWIHTTCTSMTKPGHLPEQRLIEGSNMEWLFDREA